MLYDMDWGWWAVWGGFMMLLFWGALIALAVWAIQTVTRRDGDDADRVARRRFAAGEISREEFEQIERALHSH